MKVFGNTWPRGQIMERETDYFLEDDDRAQQELGEDPEWVKWLLEVEKTLDRELRKPEPEDFK